MNFGKQNRRRCKAARAPRYASLRENDAVSWRCQRSLAGDALLVRGGEVEDIIGKQKRRPHKLTPFARVEGTRISYPPEGGEQLGLELD